MKAIILAGGQGTRLRPVIGDDLPKCMAPVMGRPVITFVINRMKKFGITDITLALGYKAEAVIKKFGHMKYKIESEPLGTGGAIKNCIEDDEPIIISNSDTICPIDYADMMKNHIPPLTIAVNEHGISAGIYILNPEIFDEYEGAFSFEHDVIPNVAHCTYETPWFSDIGTPEEYAKHTKVWI